MISFRFGLLFRLAAARKSFDDRSARSSARRSLCSACSLRGLFVWGCKLDDGRSFERAEAEGVDLSLFCWRGVEARSMNDDLRCCSFRLLWSRRSIGLALMIRRVVFVALELVAALSYSGIGDWAPLVVVEIIAVDAVGVC